MKISVSNQHRANCGVQPTVVLKVAIIRGRNLHLAVSVVGIWQRPVSSHAMRNANRAELCQSMNSIRTEVKNPQVIGSNFILYIIKFQFTINTMIKSYIVSR